MTDEEQELGYQIYQAIQDASVHSDRSKQANIGMSSLGWCSEKLRRQLDGQHEPETDHMAAFIGTAIGDHVEQAVMKRFPGALCQAEVELDLTLPDSGLSIHLAGHPDLLMPGLCVDIKTTNGLEVPRRNGPKPQQRWQRALYAKAAWEMGLLGRMPLDKVKVANAWIDRSAVDHSVLVQMERYDERDITEAMQWLEEVVYAWQHKEVARKDPPREVCFATCGFASECRGYELDATGLITDPETLTAVEIYREGVDLESRGKRLKKQATPLLAGVQGSTGEWQISHTWVNGTEVQFTRQGYDRLSLRRVK